MKGPSIVLTSLMKVKSHLVEPIAMARVQAPSLGMVLALVNKVRTNVHTSIYRGGFKLELVFYLQVFVWMHICKLDKF